MLKVLVFVRVPELFRIIEVIFGPVLRDSSFAIRFFPVRAHEVGFVAIFTRSHELDAVVNNLNGSDLVDGQLQTRSDAFHYRFLACEG